MIRNLYQSDKIEARISQVIGTKDLLYPLTSHCSIYEAYDTAVSVSHAQNDLALSFGDRKAVLVPGRMTEPSAPFG